MTDSTMADVTALDITTLVIAIVGLAAAFLSLGWQVASWWLSGPRVRAGIGYGIMTMSDGSLGPGAITVEARNVGRAETSIVSWGFRFPDGGTIVPAMNPGTWQGESLPVTLAGGHGVTWLVDPLLVAEGKHAGGFGEVELRSFVSLGSGRREVSRRAIKV